MIDCLCNSVQCSYYFMDANPIDARGCIFNQVGGDQISYNYYGPVYCYPSSHYLLCNNLSRHPATPSQLERNLLVTDDTVSVIRGTALLVDQISNLLIGSPVNSSTNYRDLEHLLRRLHQMLCLANRAIELYDNRPLGQGLTEAITLEVGQCCLLLRELLERINGTGLGLLCTCISGVWRRVFRGQCVGDELASLKRRINDSQTSLEMVLMVLNS